MKAILKAHAEAVCRILKVKTLPDLERAFMENACDAKVSAICRGVKAIATVALVESDKEWDNVLCDLIRIRFKSDLRRNQKLFLIIRLSKVAPIACINWMLEDRISGFAGLSTAFVTGRAFSGNLKVTEKRIQRHLSDIICVNGYFVLSQESFLFDLHVRSAPNGKTGWISGAEFYFGRKFEQRREKRGQS